jgi:hypothetical protein
MMIVMSDACTTNVSRSVIDNSRSINYIKVIIANDTSRVVRMTTQLRASLTIVIVRIVIFLVFRVC